ncbi:MAG: hypothetical protein V5A55_10610 [Halovenus sp.]
MAEVARKIAGPGVGQTPTDRRPVDVPDRQEQAGPPDERPANGTGNDPGQ